MGGRCVVSSVLCIFFFNKDSFTEIRYRENKPDTGKDRINQRMRRTRRLKHIGKVSMRSSRTIQSEAK